MPETPYRTALIVGVGGGLSASVARTFAKAGIKVALAARRVADLAPLAKEIGGEAFACDTTKRGDVVHLFGEVERARARGFVNDTDWNRLKDAIPPKDSFRFCDGERTLEQVLVALLKHQGHQVDAIETAVD